MHEELGEERPHTGKTRTGEEWRSEFEVDSDRLLYAPEFRRLSGVTQVISPQDDYVFHDRLTHSLKVAQVAERLAQELRHKHDDWEGGPDAQLSPRICYVAGLAHDIGHPPFGHAAEVELQAILENYHGKELLPDSFEGNAQSFRIAARLSFRKQVDSVTDAGLNLTHRSLAALSKYPWLRGGHPAGQPKLDNKWGYYNSEKRYFDELRNLGLIHPYGSDHEQLQNLEAQVMDWADDIAYAVHDLEDYFRAGRVPLDRLSRVVDDDDEWTTFVKFAIEKQAWLRESGAGLEIDEMAAVVDFVRENMPSVAFDGSRRAHTNTLDFASRMIRSLSQSCSLTREPASGKALLVITPAAKSLAEFLKAFTQYFVIFDPTVDTMQIGQRRVVRELFELLLTTTQAHFGNDSQIARRNLPARLLEYSEQVMGSDDYINYPSDEARLARAVVDFMCGLTDRQAAFLHQRMTGDAVGRLSPYWLNV